MSFPPTMADASTPVDASAPAAAAVSADEPGPAGPPRALRLLRAIGARLVAVASVLLGAATLAFVGLKLLPGDPVATLLGPQTTASPAVRAQIRADYGFDETVLRQYLHYLGELLHGRLGESYQLQQPVSALIGEQFEPTLELASAALGLAVVIAVVSA
ncbi:hypothetical protein ACWGR4_02730, partial [Embleya sp. NPDC055664]